jgi:DinB superfamily
MYNTIQDLLDAYRSTPETLQTLLRNYSYEPSVTPHGREEDWLVVEVICHLRDSEEASLQRTRLMRDQTNPRLSARDPAKLAIELNYAATSLDSALSAFLKFRADHIQELRGLRAEQWERTGEHPSMGQITISGMIAHLVAHDAIHLAQISRRLNQV